MEELFDRVYRIPGHGEAQAHPDRLMALGRLDRDRDGGVWQYRPGRKGAVL